MKGYGRFVRMERSESDMGIGGLAYAEMMVTGVDGVPIVMAEHSRVVVGGSWKGVWGIVLRVRMAVPLLGVQRSERWVM